MGWVRLDSNFARHPKITPLNDREFRQWVSLLAWNARYETRGRFQPEAAAGAIGVTNRTIERYRELGLLDLTDDGLLQVHDWEVYNPCRKPGKARTQRYREDPANRVYNTAAWRKVRDLVFERDRGECVDCGEITRSWNADHDPPSKVLLERGDDPHDLQFIFTRCHSCHSKKTRRESRAATPQSRVSTRDYADPSRARAGRGARSPLGERESDRATLSPRKDEQAIGDEGGDDAATSSGSAASSPPSPVLTGRPAEPRSATNLDTGTIADGTLDWCLGECGKKYDLDELGAEGICSSCRAKREETS